MNAQTCVEFVQAQHVWGEWSEPYPVAQLETWWQERRCQCGNRDFRPSEPLPHKGALENPERAGG